MRGEGRKDDNGGRGIKGARKKAASKATVFKRSFSWISTGRYRYIDVYIFIGPSGIIRVLIISRAKLQEEWIGSRGKKNSFVEFMTELEKYTCVCIFVVFR